MRYVYLYIRVGLHAHFKRMYVNITNFLRATLRRRRRVMITLTTSSSRRPYISSSRLFPSFRLVTAVTRRHRTLSRIVGKIKTFRFRSRCCDIRTASVIFRIKMIFNIILYFTYIEYPLSIVLMVIRKRSGICNLKLF